MGNINNVGVVLMGNNALPPGLGDDLFAFKINYNSLVNGGDTHYTTETFLKSYGKPLPIIKCAVMSMNMIG